MLRKLFLLFRKRAPPKTTFYDPNVPSSNVSDPPRGWYKPVSRLRESDEASSRPES